MLAWGIGTVSKYLLLVNNQSGGPQNFFLYQKAPKCSVAGRQVVSCSLGTTNVSQGGQWKIEFDGEIYAAIEGQGLTAAYMTTKTIVKQLVQITSADPTAKNYTKMSINPLALSPSIHEDGVPLGNFRILIPSYTPTSQYYYNAGSSEINYVGENFLSWYIVAPPAQNVDFEPEPIYYVSVGSYPQGELVPSPANNPLATCDFTNTATVISATYKADGSWCVK